MLHLLIGLVVLPLQRGVGQSIEVDANRLEMASLPTEWDLLLQELHAARCVKAQFQEARYFKFKTEPQLYDGVFRKAADGSISLAYQSGSSMALHVGPDFAYYRKGDGAAKPIPGFASRKGSVSILPALLSLNLEALSEQYHVYGRMDTSSGGWELRLVEREDASSDLDYEQIELSGVRTALQTILLRKGAMRSIQIELEAPEFPENFSAEIKEQYFFTP